MNSLVTRQDANGVCTLTLNRPQKLNALNVALFLELDAHIRALVGETETTGCVILTGAGRCFSAGHDLKDIGSGEHPPEEHFQARVIEALSALPQTVIAAVHGHCYTGALELALGADLIVAADDARFADTHAKWALTPRWGGSQRLPRLIGRQAAMDMMQTCRTVLADEALRLGLCCRVFPAAGFPASVQALAEEILGNSWFSLRGNKRLLRETEGMNLSAGLMHELHHGPGRAPDHAERIARFNRPKP
ncbi:MAG: enoyl-CoA hydratase/isomerase family protein [Burkholderiaceae bacterium]